MMTKTIGLPEAAPTCLICQAPLSFWQAQNSGLCGRPECEWRYALLRQQHEVCVVCGRPLSARELSIQTCSAPACQRAAVAERGRLVYERNEARYAALIRVLPAALRDAVWFS